MFSTSYSISNLDYIKNLYLGNQHAESQLSSRRYTSYSRFLSFNVQESYCLIVIYILSFSYIILFRINYSHCNRTFHLVWDYPVFPLQSMMINTQSGSTITFWLCQEVLRHGTRKNIMRENSSFLNTVTFLTTNFSPTINLCRSTNGIVMMNDFLRLCLITKDLGFYLIY